MRTGVRSRRCGDAGGAAPRAGARGAAALRGADDTGNAVVEFVWLAVVLMVPVVYLMLSVFDVQRASFGVTEAARQAGRTWVTSGCDQERGQRAATLALADQHVQGMPIAWPTCPPAGQARTVTVRSFVKLRGLGALLPAHRGGIEVSGSFVAVRDAFRP